MMAPTTTRPKIMGRAIRQPFWSRFTIVMQAVERCSITKNTPQEDLSTLSLSPFLLFFFDSLLPPSLSFLISSLQRADQKNQKPKVHQKKEKEHKSYLSATISSGRHQRRAA